MKGEWASAVRYRSKFARGVVGPDSSPDGISAGAKSSLYLSPRALLAIGAHRDAAAQLAFEHERWRSSTLDPPRAGASLGFMQGSDGQRFGLRQRNAGDGFTRVAVIGELDVATAGLLEQRLRDLGEAGHAVVVDLSMLSFIDACGLGSVISSVAEARRRRWALRVDPKLSTCVQRLLDLTGAAAYVWPTVDRELDDGQRRRGVHGATTSTRRVRGSGGRPAKSLRPPVRPRGW